jgi:hypothetical protein
MKELRLDADDGVWRVAFAFEIAPTHDERSTPSLSSAAIASSSNCLVCSFASWIGRKLIAGNRFTGFGISATEATKSIFTLPNTKIFLSILFPP